MKSRTVEKNKKEENVRIGYNVVELFSVFVHGGPVDVLNQENVEETA